MWRINNIRCATRTVKLSESASPEHSGQKVPKIRSSFSSKPDYGARTDSNVDDFQSCVSFGSVLEKIVSRASGKCPPLSTYNVAESNELPIWQYVLDGKVSFEPKVNTSLGAWLTYVELLAPASKTKISELAVRKIVQILNAKQYELLWKIKIKLSVPDVIEILTTLETPTSAFVFYKWIRRHSCYIPEKSIFAAVIERLITSPNLDTWDQLSVVMEDMLRKKTAIDNNQFGRLLALACEGGSRNPCSTLRMQQYVDWLLKMRHVGFVPLFSTYENMMRKCNKLKMYESTLSVFKDIPKNTYFWAFAMALSACKEMKKLDFAERIFQEMKLQNLKPDAKCFNTLLAMYADHGWADKAGKLLEEMKEQGVLMDVRAYTSVIHAYGKVGRAKQAEDIFRSIKGKLDPGIYRAMAACYRDAGYFNELLALLRESNGSLVGATCFASAFEACVEKGEWKYAIEIMKDMQAWGMSPAPRLYHMIVLACLKVDDFSTCERLEFDVRKMDASIEDLERIVIMYLSTERVSSALDALQLVNERQVGPLTAGFYEQCIRLFSKASLPDAMEMYNIMRSVGHLPSARVFTMLIQGHIETNDMLQSKRLHDDMVSAGLQPEEDIACL